VGEAHPASGVVVLFCIRHGLARAAAGRSQVLHASRSTAAEMVSVAQDTRIGAGASAVFRCRSWRQGIRHQWTNGYSVGAGPGNTELIVEHHSVVSCCFGVFGSSSRDDEHGEFLYQYRCGSCDARPSCSVWTETEERAGMGKNGNCCDSSQRRARSTTLGGYGRISRDFWMGTFRVRPGASVGRWSELGRSGSSCRNRSRERLSQRSIEISPEIID